MWLQYSFLLSLDLCVCLRRSVSELRNPDIGRFHSLENFCRDSSSSSSSSSFFFLNLALFGRKEELLRVLEKFVNWKFSQQRTKKKASKHCYDSNFWFFFNRRFRVLATTKQRLKALVLIALASQSRAFINIQNVDAFSTWRLFNLIAITSVDSVAKITKTCAKIT